jgi:hypothetical protein
VGYGLLWPAVQDALPTLAANVHALAEQSAPSHEWLAELEAVMQVLAFFVEAAPGNADIGQPLLQVRMLANWSKTTGKGWLCAKGAGNLAFDQDQIPIV